MKTFAQGFNTSAQDSNPGPRRQESEALLLSHCALQTCETEMLILIMYLKMYSKMSNTYLNTNTFNP